METRQGMAAKNFRWTVPNFPYGNKSSFRVRKEEVSLLPTVSSLCPTKAQQAHLQRQSIGIHFGAAHIPELRPSVKLK